MAGQENSIDQSLNLIFNAFLSETNTALPGYIVKYHGKQRADIQPIYQRVFLDENNKEITLDMPVLTYVPVILPVFGDAFIKFPIKEGDRVLLIVCQRAIDNFLETDGTGTIDPRENRKHDINDAVAIYGIPTNNKFLETDDNIRIGFKNNDTEYIIKKGGTIVCNETTRLEVGTEGASEALAIAKKTNEMVQELRDKVSSIVSGFNSHTHLGNLAVPTSPPVIPEPPAIFIKGPSDSQRVFTND